MVGTSRSLKSSKLVKSFPSSSYYPNEGMLPSQALMELYLNTSTNIVCRAFFKEKQLSCMTQDLQHRVGFIED